MTRYIKLALALAMLSVALTALVLSGLFGFNPLQLSIIDRLSSSSNTADLAAAVSAVTGISTAISTVLALGLGAIAVIVLIASEKSETKAIEQLKLDFAALASTLVSVRDRSLLYTQIDAIDVELDPFEHERKALTKILTSPTGWAIHSWSHEKGNEEHEGLYSSIAGLVDATTLDQRRNAQAVVNLLAERSVEVFDQICSIEERDFRRMSGALSRLSDGLSAACVTLKTDKLAQFQREMTQARAASYRAPTEAELTQLVERAIKEIGGESGKVIEQFGRLAIEGSPDDRQNFHKLISQLLGADLDDSESAT